MEKCRPRLIIFYSISWGKLTIFKMIIMKERKIGEWVGESDLKIHVLHENIFCFAIKLWTNDGLER